MTVEQVTKHREKKACGGCGQVVEHFQVVVFIGGAKDRQLVPRLHRRGDGTNCTFKADLRQESWALNQGRREQPQNGRT